MCFFQVSSKDLSEFLFIQLLKLPSMTFNWKELGSGREKSEAENHKNKWGCTKIFLTLNIFQRENGLIEFWMQLQIKFYSKLQKTLTEENMLADGFGEEIFESYFFRSPKPFFETLQASFLKS